MNPVELYKKLPAKNCGDCPQKTCMPFILAVIKGEAGLSECPHLSKAERKELEGSIKKKDWREDLIAKLSEEVKDISFPEIAEGIGAELKENALVIKCMGREFIVSPDREITTRGHMTPWIKILILHYIRTAGKGSLSGKWISYSEIKNGMVKASSFMRDCEDPLKELLKADFNKTEIILKRLGAERRKDLPAKYVWHLYLLPKVPIIILYWPEEDEFPANVKILLDSTVDRFLDAEALIFLVEGLVKNIEANIAST